MPWSQFNLCFAIASLSAYVGLHVVVQQGLLAYIRLRLAQPLLLAVLLLLCAGLFTLFGAWKRKGPPLLIGVPLMMTNALAAVYMVVQTFALYSDTSPLTLEEIIHPGIFSIVQNFLFMTYPKVQSIALILVVVCIAELSTRRRNKTAIE